MVIGLSSTLEYLEQEETAEFKSEYFNGVIIPMAGGSVNHNQIAGNIYGELNFAFKRQDYRVFIGDVRLWIPILNTFTYPDVMVIAGEPEYYQDRTDTVTNPLLIIEVLSDSTQGYDRQEKFQAYRTIPSFQEYILVSQTQVYLEQYSKVGKKQWSLREYDEEDEVISFNCVDLEVSFEEVFNKVHF